MYFRNFQLTEKKKKTMKIAETESCIVFNENILFFHPRTGVFFSTHFISIRKVVCI